MQIFTEKSIEEFINDFFSLSLFRWLYTKFHREITKIGLNNNHQPTHKSDQKQY